MSATTTYRRSAQVVLLLDALKKHEVAPNRQELGVCIYAIDALRLILRSDAGGLRHHAQPSGPHDPNVSAALTSLVFRGFVHATKDSARSSFVIAHPGEVLAEKLRVSGAYAGLLEATELLKARIEVVGWRRFLNIARFEPTLERESLRGFGYPLAPYDPFTASTVYIELVARRTLAGIWPEFEPRGTAVVEYFFNYLAARADAS